MVDKNDKVSISPSGITTRLQKGGALLEDMRAIVTLWEEGMEQGDSLQAISRALPKGTMARVKDTYSRAFRPRFLNGSPEAAWRYAQILEEYRADVQIIRPFYYWITARSEPALYKFVVERLLLSHRAGSFNVRVEDGVEWLNEVNRKEGREWTPTVTLKTSRGMLAALRDFGILEGSIRKKIAPVSLSREAFTLIAFCLHILGASGNALVGHQDWKLFLLGETGVEHMFLEAHQYGWVRFETAGNIVRTEFPEINFEEYVHVVLG